VSQLDMIKRVETLFGERAESCRISYAGKEQRERKFTATIRDVTCTADSLDDALGGLVSLLETKLLEDRRRATDLAASITERLGAST
jgi:hypothetical protein